MTHWLEHAANSEWMKIKIGQLIESDRAELMAVLMEFVPTCIRGDGLEIFKDFIRSHETEDPEIAQMAFLLSMLLGRDALRLARSEEQFAPAIECAKSTIKKKLGITFQGLFDTYCFQRSDGSYRQVRPFYGRAILDRQASIVDIHVEIESLVSPNQDRAPNKTEWMRRYPWRKTFLLLNFWRLREFQPGSEVDHAMTILNAVDELREAHQMTEHSASADSINPFKDLNTRYVAELGYKIGLHYEALRRKSFEHIVITAIERDENNRKNGELGGQAPKKRERTRILDQLANNDSGFAFASDADAIRRAKSLARDYDNKKTGEPLFSTRGKLLSDRWFSDWLDAFRATKKKL